MHLNSLSMAMKVLLDEIDGGISQRAQTADDVGNGM